MLEQIIAALLVANTADLRIFRQYIRWMMFRHRVNDTFYPNIHWIRPSRTYHWIGR